MAEAIGKTIQIGPGICIIQQAGTKIMGGKENKKKKQEQTFSNGSGPRMD